MNNVLEKTRNMSLRVFPFLFLLILN